MTSWRRLTSHRFFGASRRSLRPGSDICAQWSDLAVETLEVIEAPDDRVVTAMRQAAECGGRRPDRHPLLQCLDDPSRKGARGGDIPSSRRGPQSRRARASRQAVRVYASLGVPRVPSVPATGHPGPIGRCIRYQSGTTRSRVRIAGPICLSELPAGGGVSTCGRLTDQLVLAQPPEQLVEGQSEILRGQARGS